MNEYDKYKDLTVTILTDYLKKFGMRTLKTERVWTGVYPNNKWEIKIIRSGYIAQRRELIESCSHPNYIYSNIATIDFDGSGEEIAKFKGICKFIISEIGYKITEESSKCIKVELSKIKIKQSSLEKLERLGKISLKELRCYEKEKALAEDLARDKKEYEKLFLKYGPNISKILG
ncbi:MAG: hypothetical protein AABY15_03275 [Nanoarchaeota archaeon]